MAKEEEVLADKEVNVKGINTVNDKEEPSAPTTEVAEDNGKKSVADQFSPSLTKKKEVSSKESPKKSPVKTETPELPYNSAKDFPEALEYKAPETEEEAFAAKAGHAAAGKSASSIKGFTGHVSADRLDAAFASINLTDAIPDAAERDKFKYYNEDKLVNVFGDNVGVTFENELNDLYEFKRQQYHVQTKRFIDDLDANQSWVTEIALTAGKFIGSTAIATAGNLIGGIWGAGEALIRKDSKYIFNNIIFDGLDYGQSAIDRHLVTYGGSDVYDSVLNEETGLYEFQQKEFFARFLWHDPLKSLNADVVPAAAFVAGAVVSETIASAATAASGGLASGILASSTARIAARGMQLFGNATRVKKYSTALKMIRGLEKIPGTKAAEINRLTAGFRSSMGTISAGYRSSAYESGLIARDTEEATYHKLLTNHHIKAGGSIGDDGVITDKDGNVLDALIAPTASQDREYKRASEDAAKTAYFMNVPLVAGSHFIQMPRLFVKNYRTASSGAKSLKGRLKENVKGYFDNFKLSKTRYAKDGTRIANVDASKYVKALGYSKAILKGPLTEGFEEFAQGAMQEGLVDYYADNYSASSNRNILGMVDAIVKQSSAYVNTTEGRDSMTIGALMGLLGLRLPYSVDSATGKMKFSLRGTNMGGSRQEYKAAREKAEKAVATAEYLNGQGNLNPILKSNFQNGIRHMATQEAMDVAAKTGNVNEFKNKEHAQLFSGIYNRVKLGLGDTVLQDIDAVEQLSLEKFNEQFAPEGSEQFTEESKKEAIDKARRQSEHMLKSIEEVEQLANVQKPDLIQKAISKLTGKKILDPSHINEGFKEQLSYLNSVVRNTVKREQELTEAIHVAADGGLNIKKLEKVVSQIVGVNLNLEHEDFGKAAFTNRAKEVKKEILKEWKESDPVGYNMNVNTVSPLLDDVLKLKVRRGEAAKLYEALFTPKGAEFFANFHQALENAQSEAIAQAAREKVEQNLENTKNASIQKESKNEASVNGGATPLTDNKVTEDTVTGIAAVKDVREDDAIAREDKLAAIMKVLDTHPGLFGLVISRLQEKGVPLVGIKTAKEIELEDTEGNLIVPILEELDILTKEVEVYEATEGFEAESAEQLGQSAAPENAEEAKNAQEEALNKKSVEFKGTAEELTIMINTFDKVIHGGKLVRDRDGNLKPHPATKSDTYPIDNNKVNSPEFLNNEKLSSGTHTFEFRIQKDNAFNKTATTDNMAIAVVYVDPKTGKETFISRLPAFKEGGPQHLKELREEIIRRDETGSDATIKKKADRIQEIKKEKEVIKKKLQENLDAKKEAPVADTQTSEVVLTSETVIDKKGRKFTFFENTKTKNGVVKTTYTFNRSDKDSSQRNPTGVKSEIALDNKGYKVSEDSIPEGSVINQVYEVRVDENDPSKSGANVEFITENGDTFRAEVQLELKQQPTPQTSEVERKGTINVYWGQAESESSTKILSNLAPRKFTWKSREYGSVEHAYQSNKSGAFDQNTYNKYNEIGGYGKKIRGKGTVAEMKAADSLGLMKQLVVESFKQNTNSEAAKKLMQYENFTHNTNQLIDKAFLEGLKLAQAEIISKSAQPTQTSEVEAKKKEIARREKQLKSTQEKVDREYQEENWTEEEKEWNKTAGEQVIEGDGIDLGIKVDERTDKSKKGVRVITNVVKKGTSKTRQEVDVTQFDSQEAADQWVKEKAEKIKNLHQKNLDKIDAKYDAKIAALDTQTSDVDVFVEASDFVIEGITDGWNVLAGNEADGVGDVRNQTRDFKPKYIETIKGDKKIFSYLVPGFKEHAAAGRHGYFSVSIAVPSSSTTILNDFKDALKSKADEIIAANPTKGRGKLILNPNISVAKPTQQTSGVENSKTPIEGLNKRLEEYGNSTVVLSDDFNKGVRPKGRLNSFKASIITVSDNIISLADVNLNEFDFLNAQDKQRLDRLRPLAKELEELNLTISSNDSRTVSVEKRFAQLTNQLANEFVDIVGKHVEQQLGKTISTSNPAQQTSEITEKEFKEFTDNATVSDERVNSIANKIKAGEALTKQELSMRNTASERVEKVLKTETTTEVTEKEFNNKLETFFSNFGIVFKEGDSSVDLLRKIAHFNKDNKDADYVDNSVKLLSHMMLASPIIDYPKIQGLIEETAEFKKEIAKDKDVEKTYQYLKEGNRIPMEEWVEYIKKYNSIRDNILQKHLKESLLDSKNNKTKLHSVIADFIKWFQDLFKNAKNVKQLTDAVVSQVMANNKEVILGGQQTKDKEILSLEKALEETSHGEDIINFLGGKGLTLVGSVAVGEQGTVYRKLGHVLHDIDWVVPFDYKGEDPSKILLEEYKGSSMVREFDSKAYYTKTYIVAPKGHTVMNLTFFKPELYDRKYTQSYDVVNNETGEVVSNYRRTLKEKEVSKKVIATSEVYNEGLENVPAELNGLSVDLFYNKEKAKFDPIKTTLPSGVEIDISHWMASFTEKLKYGRNKDLVDWVNFIPNKRKMDTASTAPSVQNTVDAKQEKLKAELNILNEELRGLAGSITVPLVENKEKIFGRLSDFKAIKAKKLKKTVEGKLVEDFGEKNIKRAEAINENFQDILKAIETSGVQIFFDPETNKHENC